MRVALILSAALVLTACVGGPTVDVTAGPGEPNALDGVCRIATSEEGSRVTAICPSQIVPGEAVVRASLEQGYGYRIAPYLREPVVRISGGGVGYSFRTLAPDEPIRVPPDYPAAALRGRHVANCAVEFDLTAEGAPTNICVECAATGVPELFEDSIRSAFEQWVYPTASEAGADAQRTDLRTVINMDLNDGANGRVAPPAPESACPVDDQ